MTRMTSAQYKTLIEFNSAERAKKSKYGAKPTTVDAIRFHSRKEAEYYKKLKIQQSKGEIARFHRQVLFDLPGGIKHYVDFQLIYYDPHYHFETIEYVEVKGRDTPIAKLKRKQCEQIYGIEIKVV